MPIGRRDREPLAGTTEIITRPGRRRAGLVAALVTAALLVAGLTAPAASATEPAAAGAPPTLPRALPSQPPPPEFVPPPECQAQHTALLAVKQQIDAHNARPHLFRLPAQAAQLAAYDAEAGQLNSAQQTAVSNLELCLQQVARARALAALAGVEPGGPPVRAAAPDTRQELHEARRNIPSNWTPPPPPPSGKPWRVDSSSPVRPVYDVLRKRNPGDIGNVTLRGVPRPRAEDPDPAYPGSSIGRRPSGSVNVSPDHIIPLAELVQMPGFTLLNPDNMYAVANAPLNLQWLSGRANLAKGSGRAADILGVDPGWQRAQDALEQEVRAQLRDLIAFLVYSQGEG
jgi:hypothetical protein